MYFSKIEDCSSTIKRLINSGVAPEDAWNRTTIKLTQASEVCIKSYNQKKLIIFTVVYKY